jgi:hypothetical protein
VLPSIFETWSPMLLRALANSAGVVGDGMSSMS